MDAKEGAVETFGVKDLEFNFFCTIFAPQYIKKSLTSLLRR